MKNTILTIGFFLCALVINAQDKLYYIEAHANLLTEDVKEPYGTSLGASGKYFFEIADKFRAGPTIGIDYAEGKEELKDLYFLPVGGSLFYGELSRDGGIGLGVDVGYSVGLSPSTNKGGLHYRPYFVWSFLQIAYTTTELENGKNFTAVQLSFSFSF